MQLTTFFSKTPALIFVDLLTIMLLFAPVVAFSLVSTVTELYRFAVKGLSGDRLDHVDLESSRFPDDRKYALLKADREWNGNEWLHKENFLCAFTDPLLMASFRSSYKKDDGTLTIRDRKTDALLLGPVSLEQEEGRKALAKFMSEQSGENVVCVASDSFQFGNTSSGVKNRKDSRTIHIVNQATVDQLSKTVGVPITASRFRPNLVIDGPPAWSEFTWIGKTLQSENGLKLTVINKTVRCAGVGIDPLDPARGVLDIPSLLVEHFPEHGPYLGVYAVVDSPGSLALGDDLKLLD